MTKTRLHNQRIYPITMLPHGDDKKLKAYHVLRCMDQPPCSHELRIPSGTGRPLPPHAVAKRAQQAGWHADRRGYCLCPDHTPWAKRHGEPSKLPPEQRRAAYVAIRERHLNAPPAMDPAVKEQLVRMYSSHHPDVLAAARADPRIAKLRFDAPTNTLAALEALLPAIANGVFTKGWRGRVADSIGMNEKTFSQCVHRLVKLGYLAPVPGTFKLIVRKQQPKENTTMIEPTAAPSGALDVALAVAGPGQREEALVVPPRAEPPPQPTLADNRRIRAFLDENYDEDGGRWCADLSDERAAARLKVPRAWIAVIRSSFYGEDVNEAGVERIAAAGELAAAAALLQEDALKIAERAEALERQARALLAQ